MRWVVAEVTEATVAVYAAVVGGIAAALTGAFTWLRSRSRLKFNHRKNRISFHGKLIEQLSNRVTALEKLCVAQQMEITTLNQQVNTLTGDNARLAEQNRHLRLEEQRVEKVRQEKHDAVGALTAAQLTIVLLKTELNKADEQAGRPPRFAHPDVPELEDEDAEDEHP